MDMTELQWIELEALVHNSDVDLGQPAVLSSD